MKLVDIKRIIDADVLTGEFELDQSVEMGCSSDLMSDILAFGKPGSILITSLMNIQVINTVNIADINVVCFVMNKIPDENIINLAKKDNIVIFSTKLTTFETCGRLFKNGLKSCSYLNFEK